MHKSWFDQISSALIQGTAARRKSTATVLSDRLIKLYGSPDVPAVSRHFWEHVQALSEEAAFQYRLWLKSRRGDPGRPKEYRSVVLPVAFASLQPQELTENCSDTQTELNLNAVREALNVACSLYVYSVPIAGLGEVVILRDLLPDPVALCLPSPTPTGAQLKKDLKDASRIACKVEDEHLPWLAMAHLVHKGYALREIYAQVDWPV